MKGTATIVGDLNRFIDENHIPALTPVLVKTGDYHGSAVLSYERVQIKPGYMSEMCLVIKRK